MRARIRTVKPEFFKHEDLFETELETGLPVRLAYIGLWTQADREGRFEWRPRILKTDIMPYDEVDFSRVLDALSSRGLVVRYAVQGKAYGFIPSWHRHQVINNRESGSLLPPPPESIETFDASATREPRVTDLHVHAPVELELELEQNEPNGSTLSEPTVSDEPKPARSKRDYPGDFEAAWLAYPNRNGMSKAEALPQWKKLSVEDRAKVLPSIPGYLALLKAKPDLETIHFCRYLKYRRFEGFAGAAVTELETPAVWLKRLVFARDHRVWSTVNLGPMPGQSGCRVPADLLAEGDGTGWAEARAA